MTRPSARADCAVSGSGASRGRACRFGSWGGILYRGVRGLRTVYPARTVTDSISPARSAKSASAAWVSLSATSTGAAGWSSRSNAGASVAASARIGGGSAGVKTGAEYWASCCAAAQLPEWRRAAPRASRFRVARTMPPIHPIDQLRAPRIQPAREFQSSSGGNRFRRRLRNRFVEFRLDHGNGKFLRRGRSRVARMLA